MGNEFLQGEGMRGCRGGFTEEEVLERGIEV